MLMSVSGSAQSAR
jgi:hypothetical protein